MTFSLTRGVAALVSISFVSCTASSAGSSGSSDAAQQPAPAPAQAAPKRAAGGADDTPHGGMLRYPDVSATQIVFVYADDLWLVPREGGVASPLASPPGLETLPRFNADGSVIAFVGNYDGNRDVYTVATAGGVPKRVTHHPSSEALCDWTPDGRLMFFTSGFAGRDRQVQLFTVAADGGLPEPLPVPYGAFASIAPDRRWLAYTPHTVDNRTWKRYRGGMSTDIWLFDLETKAAKRATEWEGTDTAPMWNGKTLCYLSDDGPSHRQNLWSYDPAGNKRKQLTTYADFDVKWPAIGPGPKGTGEIVFQHGAELCLFDLASSQTRVVQVTVPGARAALRPRAVDAAKFIDGWELSPSGKRVLVSARGDVWTLPAKKGSPRDLTRTSGAAERDPSWSPDGKSIAWLSDASGEYEVYVAPADGSSEPKQLTHGGKAFRRLLCWSPDSKRVVFSDKTGSLFLLAVDGGEPKLVDQDRWAGDLIGTAPSFSHDSRYMAFARADDVTGSGRITIVDVESGEKHVVTSGMFDDALPTFDRKGDWMYFRRRAHFEPSYSELDTTFIYAGTGQLCVVPLRADQTLPFGPKSDEEGADDDKKKDDDEKDDAKKEDGKKDDAKKDAKPGDAKPGEEKTADAKDDKDDDKKPREKVEIAFDGFERRVTALEIVPGAFAQLAVNDKNVLLYLRQPPENQGAEPKVQAYDITADEPKEEDVAEEVQAFALSADGKKLLALGEKGAQLGDAKVDTKLEKLSTDGMEIAIDPRAEWRELFDDAWRLYRDFFYDPAMHSVDWNALRQTYGAMLGDCASREDVSYVIKELISELNVGHAYYSGGDTGSVPSRSVGLLACDFALEQGAYRIKRIHEGAAWDLDGRGPLSQPGVDVKEGDWLLAVNGAPLDVNKDPWAALQGLAKKSVTLRVSATPTLDASARTVVVEPLASDSPVRYRAWIEHNRQYVEKKTEGRVGYVYVPDTGINGQNDLVRQMQGQQRKDALIVDERWNGGGQIPTRFIELLDRPITNYWARRDGFDWPWPPDGHQGPKCMLINGLSGSGGDAFPFYFKQAGLGKLIGTRTWGGLVGLSGYPHLIDGGDVEVPSFAFYEKDGTWGVEGHGVDPDIEVIDDPSKMQNGADPQLDRAIELMLEELRTRPYKAPKRPAYPNRSGMGLAPTDR